MYDKRRVKKPSSLTLEWILSRVSEYDIYSHYLGEFKVGAIYNSPFRRDDNPSFGVYYSKRGNCLLFKDYGTGECGGVVKFVSLITGKTDYQEILKDIKKQLKITPSTKLKSSRQFVPPNETEIGVVRQPFNQIDLDYWSSFGITKDTLVKFNVNSIKYYLCNGVVKGIYKEDNPMYSYKVNNHFKIYRPLGLKHSKWRNNLTEDDIQGYQQLPRNGDVLIITKSLKDVMCLYEMGISAISPSSESSWFKDKAIEDILRRFKRIYICFDRDPCGVRNLRKISLKTGFTPILVPKRFKAKDISDAIMLNGMEKVKKWLEKELKKKAE